MKNEIHGWRRPGVTLALGLALTASVVFAGPRWRRGRC